MGIFEVGSVQDRVFVGRHEIFAEEVWMKLEAMPLDMAGSELARAIQFEISETIFGNDREQQLINALVASRLREHWILHQLGDLLLKSAQEDLSRTKGQEQTRNGMYLDMRSDVTGLNWHQIEADGRWSGPGTRSILQVPSLGVGRWQVELAVLGEVDAGLVDTLKLVINGIEQRMIRSKRGFPCILSCLLDVPVSYKWPFWRFQFDFSSCRSPSERGVDDPRLLSVKLASLYVQRAGD